MGSRHSWWVWFSCFLAGAVFGCGGNAPESTKGAGEVGVSVRVDWAPVPPPEVLKGHALTGVWERSPRASGRDATAPPRVTIKVLEPATVGDVFGPGKDYATISVDDEKYILRYSKTDHYWGVTAHCVLAHCRSGEMISIEAYKADNGQRGLSLVLHAESKDSRDLAARTDAVAYTLAD